MDVLQGWVHHPDVLRLDALSRPVRSPICRVWAMVPSIRAGDTVLEFVGKGGGSANGLYHGPGHAHARDLVGNGFGGFISD